MKGAKMGMTHEKSDQVCMYRIRRRSDRYIGRADAFGRSLGGYHNRGCGMRS